MVGWLALKRTPGLGFHDEGIGEQFLNGLSLLAHLSSDSKEELSRAALPPAQIREGIS